MLGTAMLPYLHSAEINAKKKNEAVKIIRYHNRSLICIYEVLNGVELNS